MGVGEGRQGGPPDEEIRVQKGKKSKDARQQNLQTSALEERGNVV